MHFPEPRSRRDIRLTRAGAPLKGLSDPHNAAIVREMAAETNAKRAQSAAAASPGAQDGFVSYPGAGAAEEPYGAVGGLGRARAPWVGGKGRA